MAYLVTMEPGGLRYLGPSAMPPPGMPNHPYIIPHNGMSSSGIVHFNGPFNSGQIPPHLPQLPQLPSMPLPAIAPSGGLNMTPFNGGPMPGPPSMPLPGMAPSGGPIPSIPSMPRMPSMPAPGIAPSDGPMPSIPSMPSMPSMPAPGIARFGISGATPFNDGHVILPLMSIPQSGIASFGGSNIVSASQPWTGMVAPAATTHAAGPFPPTYSIATTGPHARYTNGAV